MRSDCTQAADTEAQWRGAGEIMRAGQVAHLVDVRDHTAARDGGLDQRVQLLITADGELKVARSDALHLEVLAGVAGKLEDLGCRWGGRGARAR